MKYQNPIVSGFYPDPSVCKANGKYYLVCSTFQYFPGVVLFESKDLVNWTQIGHVLTRESQLPLKKSLASEGIFAPTIRYNNGRFYMVTTNVSEGGNFYVWTDDIYGEWSEPIWVEQDGIDPSFYFEDGKAYFMSNGSDDDGIGGVVQCELDINTGKKLSKSRCIWQGTGGRYLESPHMYKIGDYYYLMAAEGGTEYGHMVVYARSKELYGPFESYAGNPVLTNRNLGGYQIQGAGHADLVQDDNGDWWMLHLAFRQMSQWRQYHITGREVYMVPVNFDGNGWFTAGLDGTCRLTYDLPERKSDAIQNKEVKFTFNNTKMGREWCYLRHPAKENYSMENGMLKLYGTNGLLTEYQDCPTALFIRQKEMEGTVRFKVTVPEGEAGVTLYMNESFHYDIALAKTDEGFKIRRRTCIGDDIRSLPEQIKLTESKGLGSHTVEFVITMDPMYYEFEAIVGNEKLSLGRGDTKLLTKEVTEGFTGVMIGLYAYSDVERAKEPACFEDFSIVYAG